MSLSLSTPRLIEHTPTDGGAAVPLPLDVRALRKRLELVRRKHGNLRFMRAGFRIPWPISEWALEQALNKAMDKWVKVQESRGWTLRSKPRVIGMAPAYETSGDWYKAAMLDMREVQVMAAFSTDAKPVRIELEVTQS